MVPVSGETNTESLNTKPINFISANKVEDGTAIIYKDDIDTIQYINDIIYHNILTGKNSLPTQGEEGEVIRSQVKACADEFNQEQDMFLVSIDDC